MRIVGEAAGRELSAAAANRNLEPAAALV
jgi:hypothetical protein